MKKFITIFCVAISLHTFAAVRLVPMQYPTIQSALDAAKSGDTILVSAGIYQENIIWPQTNDLHLMGVESKKPSVIIDGGGTGRVIDIEWSGTNALQAEINGLTIQNGFIDVPAHLGGRGAGIFASNAAIRLVNCFIIRNRITTGAAIQNSGGGAGIHFESTPAGSASIISGCFFSSNIIQDVTNGSGSAIELDNAPATILHTVINDNKMSVEEVGIGTVYAFQSPLKINGVKIEGNIIATRENILPGQAAIKGGAVFSYLSTTTIANLLADNNLLTPFNTGLALLGSGIYYYGEGAGFKMSNSTIANNKRTDGAPVNGTALYFSTSDGKLASVFNSILWNVDNGPEIYNQTRKLVASYCDVREGYNGTGNINGDPRFISATDLHLQLSSSCINAGNNAYAPEKDLEGNKRPQPVGSNTDMGCYEMNQPSFAGLLQNIHENDDPVVIYPNPSKGAFKLVVGNSWIGSQVQIRNNAGVVLINRKITAAETDFSSNDWQKGIYFIALNNNIGLQKVLSLVIEQ